MGCKNYEDTKYMTFVLDGKHKKILERHNKIPRKTISVVKKHFEAESV